MKKNLAFLFPVILLFACSKKETVINPEPLPQPNMVYTDLKNVSMKFNEAKGIDIDHDNKIDFLFATLWVGDPALKRERKQFHVNSDVDAYLLINNQEQVPALNQNDPVSLSIHPGYQWFDIGSIVIAEKISEENGTVHWEGNWKEASHRYLPVHLKKGNSRYTGWIELSFNTSSEELILHKAAFNTVADQDIKAGR